MESIQALQLETSSVARALKDTIAAREKQLVEHDVLKLQVCAQPQTMQCSIGLVNTSTRAVRYIQRAHADGSGSTLTNAVDQCFDEHCSRLGLVLRVPGPGRANKTTFIHAHHHGPALLTC